MGRQRPPPGRYRENPGETFSKKRVGGTGKDSKGGEWGQALNLEKKRMEENGAKEKGGEVRCRKSRGIVRGGGRKRGKEGGAEKE